MKTNKKLKRAITLALPAAVLFACKQPKPNTVPEPDTETQSTIDAVWATQVISDIETQCSFMAEGNRSQHFYTEVPGTATASQGSVTATFNAPAWNMGFFKTQCLDGHLREGTVFMQTEGFNANEIATYFPRWKPDSRYTHSYGFGGFITLSEYKIDGWKVETIDGVPAVISNQINDAGYDPAVTPLKWKISGRFKFTHPTDPNKNMIWEGELVKTCINSTDRNVFNATKAHNQDGFIKWEYANVSYSGKISGMAGGNIPFKMTINEQSAITRDFTCAAYPVGGVVLTPTVSVIKQESHPFIKGEAQLNTVNKDGVEQYPRYINFNGNTNGDAIAGCDNTGKIEIKGITYKIDFNN